MILLTTPIILILTIIALILAVFARFVRQDMVQAGIYIASFLAVAACVVYGFLSGASYMEILVYILFFTVLGLTNFLSSDGKQLKAQTDKQTELPQKTNDENTVEDKNDIAATEVLEPSVPETSINAQKENGNEF